MLVCAHPAIERAVRTPLMLNTVLGFTAEQVGRAFSVPTSTMATRLVRAKKRIKVARIPFHVPGRSDLAARMAAVLEAVYGAYVIDWATTGPQAHQLPSEALHLAEVLTTLVPADPEAHGLAALVQLSAARASARTDASGRFVPLADQDPSLWNADLVNRAHEHLRAAHARGQLGRFQIEAAIQAVHCARRQGGETDWPTLLTLHRLLHTVAPSPPRSMAPLPDSPRSTPCWKKPASTPAASSRRGPRAPTCSTDSDVARKPWQPMTARSP
jgi:RNA polymerase sigma-70 factor (ECF subfamily)